MMISRLGVRKNLRIHKLVYCHVRYMATHTSTALILALVPFLVGSFYMSTLCHYDQPKRIIEFFEEDVDVNTNLPDASMTAILDEIPEKYPNRPIWYTGVPALYTQPIVLIGHPGFNDVCDCMDYAVDVFRNQFIPYIRIFDEMIRDSSDMDVCFRPAPEISFFRQLCQVYRTMNTTVQYPVGLIIGQTHNLIQFGAGAFERFLEMYDFGFTKSATGSVKDLKLAHVFFSDPKPIHHFPLVVLYGLGLVYAYQAIKSIAPKKNCVSITLSSAFQLIVSVYYAYRIEQYLNSSSGYDPMSSALFVAVLIGLESTVGIVEATISATRLVPPPALPDSIAYGYAQSTDKFLYQFTAIVCVAGIGASCPILKLRSFSTCLLLAMCIQTILQLTSFIAVLSVELSGLYEKLNLYRATTALSFVLGICIVSIPSQSSIVTKENEYSWVINTLRIDHRSNLNHRYFTIFKQPTLLVEAKMCESRNDRENQEVPKLMSTAKRSNENAVNLIVPLVIVATTLTFLTTTLFVSNFVVDSEDHPINDKSQLLVHGAILLTSSCYLSTLSLMFFQSEDTCRC